MRGQIVAEVTAGLSDGLFDRDWKVSTVQRAGARRRSHSCFSRTSDLLAAGLTQRIKAYFHVRNSSTPLLDAIMLQQDIMQMRSSRYEIHISKLYANTIMLV